MKTYLALLPLLPALVPAMLLGYVRQPLDEIRIERYQAAQMRDGVVLYADVYRPRAEGRYPTLVVRTPYGVQRDGVHESMIKFAQRGYAVVVQDVRGRYESQGDWVPFRSEARDGYDTIEWAARQPWSNGKVAMQGGSYLGHVQWRAATSAPPGLLAIFPEVASTNIYGNWITHGGAFRLSFNYGWGVVRMPNRIMLPQYWHTESFAPPELQYDAVLKNLPLATLDLASGGYAVGHYRDWIAHPGYDRYWKTINDEEHFSEVNVPVHTSGGWFDIFLGGTINGFSGVRKQGATEKARRETRMIIGAWGHGPSRKYGDVDFGPDAARVMFERELRWFDHYLKDVNNGIDREPPVEIFYMGVNKWKLEQDWPLPGTRFTPFYLGSRGVLVEQPSKIAERDEYTYDPNNPVPTVGGNNCCGTPTIAGPRDQRTIESRKDVLGYSSAPLDSPLAIAGPVKLKLFASTDGRDTDWVAKLVDVYPDGSAMNIAEGILRARYRKGTQNEELLNPGEVYEFDVDLIATANVFLPGHRIRVDITSSNFPQFDRNPNTGAPFGSSARVRIARQAVFHGPGKGSHILLPVVPLP